MNKQAVLEKSRCWGARILSIFGVVIFGLSFLVYFAEEHKSFIVSSAMQKWWDWDIIAQVFAASGLRFTLRLAYVISFVGLFFLRRWSVYLCLIAWLGQLVPSTIFSLIQGDALDAGHFFSFVSLLVYLGLIALCWPVLKPGKSFRFCGGALGLGLVLHTMLFVSYFESASSIAASLGRVDN